MLCSSACLLAVLHELHKSRHADDNTSDVSSKQEKHRRF